MAGGGNLCRPHPAGREARRTASSGADQVRVGGQPQDREGDWGAHPASISAARRRGDRMKRREFITLMGGAAAAWSLAARAQAQRLRRIGVLTGDAEDDPEVRARFTAFQQGLESLGWSVGGNIRIDYRFAANNLDRYQPLAKELVRLRPDLLLAYATPI